MKLEEEIKKSNTSVEKVEDEKSRVSFCIDLIPLMALRQHGSEIFVLKNFSIFHCLVDWNLLHVFAETIACRKAKVREREKLKMSKIAAVPKKQKRTRKDHMTIN